MTAAPTPAAASHDPWTVAAIAIVAYCIANVLHEGLGHGGACLLVGCTPEMLNAIFFTYDEKAATSGMQRVIASGGSIVNLVVAAGCLGLLASGSPKSARERYFVWLFTAVNLLMAFGYLMFSGIGGIGDWDAVVAGMPGYVAWRIAMAIAGAGLYFFVAPRLLMPTFAHFINAGGDKRAQVRALMLVPYLVGGVTFVVAGLFNPYGLGLVLISAAAASFGGTSLLAWFPADKRVPALGASSGTPFVIARSRGWLVAACVTLVIFIGVLGPGIALVKGSA